VERQHILQNQLPWISLVTYSLVYDVEPDAIPTFGEESVRPSAQAAIEINHEHALMNDPHRGEHDQHHVAHVARSEASWVLACAYAFSLIDRNLDIQIVHHSIAV